MDIYEEFNCTVCNKRLNFSKSATYSIRKKIKNGKETLCLSCAGKKRHALKPAGFWHNHKVPNCVECGKKIVVSKIAWLTDGHVFRCHLCSVRRGVALRVARQKELRVPDIFLNCADCGRKLKSTSKYWKAEVPRCISCATINFFKLKKKKEDQHKLEKYGQDAFSLAYCFTCSKQLTSPNWVWKSRNKNPSCSACSAKRRPKRLGVLNGMYGKKRSQGYSGRYGGLRFRSLLELVFLLSKDISKIKSAENKNWVVQYCVEGKVRKYYPDFILEDGTVVEIKPSGLVKIPVNQIKMSAAKIKFGDKYLVLTELDIPEYDITKIKILVIDGKITFNKGVTERFEIRWGKILSA